MEFIERKLGLILQQTVKDFPALVLAGPRQTGKTTLLQRLFPNHHYVTLDRPLLAEQAESDPEAFLFQHPSPLIIDEVQYAPGLFRYLKIAIDQNRTLKGQYILTGSQKFTLMKGVSESLAGRVAVFDFEGLSGIELIEAGLIQPDLAGITAMLTRGGFPELWSEPSRSVERYLDSYIATNLERDVKQVLSVGSLRDFERFLRACALRSAQQLNKSDLARDVGISVPTVGEWLSVLQALGHIVLLEPWFGNLNKRLVKSPKLFFTDTGLLCRLCGIPAEQLLNSPVIGHVWETFVFAELRKQMAFSGGKGRIWYYRDQNQREVDFIWENGHELTLYECKWSSTPTIAAARDLAAVQELFEQVTPKLWRVVSKKIISRASEVFENQGVTFCSPFDGLMANLSR